jgi:arylsulfatase A-like enzyme
VSTESRLLAAGLSAALWACEGRPQPAARRQASLSPNIVLAVVDTLRADRLGAYGYRRATSPEIDARLAARGAVFERAYACAPWTLPSMMALLTGRAPGPFLGEGPAAGVLPAGIPTLAERLRARGYATAYLGANPTMEPRLGLSRGFTEYSVPPPVVESLALHADDLDARLQAWLARKPAEPFFLAVHYIDPHDPYENPSLVAGRSALLPGYEGPVRGSWVHGLYAGQLSLPDGARGIAQLDALYDSEVRYVDGFVGRLLEALGPHLDRTLVVLTADHGEELHDHGGWKHGQTLYDEQVRVPLLVRWDGRVRPGLRLSEPVSLLDVAPTLTAAAGGQPDPETEGRDLLPVLRGTGPGPAPVPLFARHLAGGPLRAMVLAERHKLVLFNRAERFAPRDELDGVLWRRDLGRLRRIELYDLEADPLERHDLAAQRPEVVARLLPPLEARLDAELAGLQVRAARAIGGGRLTGSLTFDRTVPAFVPHLLEPEDRLWAEQRRLRFALRLDAVRKGWRIHGEFGRLEAVELRLDGRSVGPERTWAGRAAYAGEPISAEALRARPPEGRPDTLLTIWLAADAVRTAAPDGEAAARLRALGYVQ